MHSVRESVPALRIPPPPCPGAPFCPRAGVVGTDSDTVAPTAPFGARPSVIVRRCSETFTALTSKTRSMLSPSITVLVALAPTMVRWSVMSRSPTALVSSFPASDSV